MSTPRPPVIHLNPSPTLGGAEIYTHFLAQSLARGGWDNRIVVAPEARYWDGLVTDGIQLQRHDFRLRDGLPDLPPGALICVHAPVPKGLLDRLARKHRLLGLAHQAIYSTSIPYYYSAAHRLLPVSSYVADTLRRAGFSHIQDQPLWGVAALSRGAADAEIVRGPQVEWDRRKLRDRLLAGLEPLAARWTGAVTFTRRPGLNLGVVSRLAPLKQFPELFRALMPVLVAQPDVNLDFFGAAIGYRHFRELGTVLRPLGSRVRFWGFQRSVAAVYPQLDYLLTGLPEREALGLNVIEAQQCGVPVLAPAAPPFTETVLDGLCGYLYSDPRRDGAAGFAAALQRARAARPDPRLQAAHLARFSEAAFDARSQAIFSEEADRATQDAAGGPGA